VPVKKDKAPLIKWLRFTRTRYGITWEEVESIKYKLIELIHEKKGVDLGRVDL